ncbi:MAG: S8 family serine peptidase [Deltaproteobacteria bacterium]|nr:S8 family serine peptidase [Deltaproteobacteria bacterium]
MRKRGINAAVLAAVIFWWDATAAAFDVAWRFPTFASHAVRTTDPLTVVFDDSVNTATVDGASFTITDTFESASVSGGFSFATTNTPDDTVIFTPDAPWVWGRRYRLAIGADLESAGGDPFAGTLEDDGLFVANVPNDFHLPLYDPLDPLAMMTKSAEQMGFNPLDPEADAEPWEIPGFNATGAWKYTTGSPDVVIAIIDTGLKRYDDEEIRRAIFLNAGELPLPNDGGEPCADYDCNGDGRFDVDDYATDDRLSGGPPYSAQDLIDAFSNGVDEDGNALVDDIAGWDFWRGANLGLGDEDLPDGTHGHGRAVQAASAGDNGIGSAPGVCPHCRILPLRASPGLVYDYGPLAAAARYASSMGARVMSFAGVNFSYSEEDHRAFQDAYENGAVTMAVSGDEMTYHHWMPSAGEDVIALKTTFAFPPVDLIGNFNLESIAFLEGPCTNYGAHVEIAIPSDTGCSSEGAGSSSGMMGLIFSRAEELGIDLSAEEARQLLTMTAYDIQNRCAAISTLAGGCIEGYDEHFGYGRPDLEKAVRALGDPDFGLPARIPPAVRVTSPRWWTTFDPAVETAIDVEADVSARTYPLAYTVEVARGRQPREDEFATVTTGTLTGPHSGPLADVRLDVYFPMSWAAKPVRTRYDFDVTLRVRASYDPGDGAVFGEARKAISVRADREPGRGLVPGFPIHVGASGESAPILYDLDGAPDGRLEIVFGTGAGKVEAFKHDNETLTWQPLAGFPIDLSGDSPWQRDTIFASLAVGDIANDGLPEIVAATTRGLVYVINPLLAAGGDPVLPGFPVGSDPAPNDSAFSYAFGNGFLSPRPGRSRRRRRAGYHRRGYGRKKFTPGRSARKAKVCRNSFPVGRFSRARTTVSFPRTPSATVSIFRRRLWARRRRPFSTRTTTIRRSRSARRWWSRPTRRARAGPRASMRSITTARNTRAARFFRDGPRRSRPRSAA